ncbi:LpqB family beta-propeller domain-containing protein [Microbacterium sp. LRZ72]|uniref:LpqB family beta-propeller domain-containing protein n=1 Tax=Microbacterium sp. LRZ72 TaxID=2942481 RepID=UPI0029AA436C|nr:GerMN domain-containing protein [Microbacterium sp. LRZ72]MDX2377055.1 LpqB family beta-propeller domain-containing protein [Microbacterium sp. LRZ72]
MRARTVAALTALVLVLAGCAGLPRSGPVNPGPELGSEPVVPDFSFFPDGPQPGATPRQIVEGFVSAATNPEDGWATARLFLAPDVREEWDPLSGVTIDELGEREIAELDDDTVEIEAEPIADLDAAGAYSAVADGGASFTYELAEQEDGEWRISVAPTGLLLDAESFDTVFRSASIMYFDPAWRFLVPDVRWYPERTNLATHIAQAIVEGVPSPWLAESVVSAVPEDVALSQQAVTVEAGVAQVELSSSALEADPVALGRMLRQLQGSLGGTGITGVELLVDGAALSVQPARVESTSIDAQPLVLAADGFGYLSGDEVTPIEGLSEAVEGLGIVSAALGRGAEAVAVRTEGGAFRVDAESGVTPVDARAGMIDPAIDPDGAIWSVPAGSPGRLQATTADGEPIAIEGAWSGFDGIEAMQVSRDGTRMAAIVRSGATSWLTVSGIIRDADLRPVGLGEPVRLNALAGESGDVAWLDDQTLAAVVEGTDAALVREQTVGGLSVQEDAPGPEIAALAAGATSASVRALVPEGDLYQRRGIAWTLAAEGVAVLGSQLGSG